MRLAVLTSTGKYVKSNRPDTIEAYKNYGSVFWTITTKPEFYKVKCSGNYLLRFKGKIGSIIRSAMQSKPGDLFKGIQLQGMDGLIYVLDWKKAKNMDEFGVFIPIAKTIDPDAPF